MFSHAHLRLEVSKVMGVAPNQPSHTPISQADGGDTVIPCHTKLHLSPDELS